MKLSKKESFIFDAKKIIFFFRQSFSLHFMNAFTIIREREREREGKGSIRIENSILKNLNPKLFQVKRDEFDMFDSVCWSFEYNFFKYKYLTSA